MAAILQHFAGSLIFMKKNKIFFKKKGNTFTLLTTFIVKSFQIYYYYDPKSTGITVQSPKSESTPRRLTLDNSIACIKIVCSEDENRILKRLFLHILLEQISTVPICSGRPEGDIEKIS